MDLLLERGGFLGRGRDAVCAEAEREQARAQLGVADLVGAQGAAAAEQANASEPAQPLAR